MAGYGRRRLPHCVTDGEGPEKFGICGRPLPCTKDHRATKASVELSTSISLYVTSSLISIVLS